MRRKRYRKWFWRCPKCHGWRHRASYLGYDNTMSITCNNCNFNEYRRPA